jgi:hypothetical protein
MLSWHAAGLRSRATRIRSDHPRDQRQSSADRWNSQVSGNIPSRLTDERIESRITWARRPHPSQPIVGTNRRWLRAATPRGNRSSRQAWRGPHFMLYFDTCLAARLPSGLALDATRSPHAGSLTPPGTRLQLIQLATSSSQGAALHLAQQLSCWRSLTEERLQKYCLARRLSRIRQGRLSVTSQPLILAGKPDPNFAS